MRTKVPIKLIQNSKFYYFRKCEIYTFIYSYSFNIIFSQLRLPVNDSVQNFLFAKSQLNDPIIITVNGIHEYKSKWKYSPFS